MIFPEPHNIPYYAFIPAVPAAVDSHGNAVGDVSETPVTRKAIAFYRKYSQEPISADTVARYISEVTMLVRKPDEYSSQDEVDIAGRRFAVVGPGVDGDWRNGPWAKYSKLFGGEIQLRRVG